MTIDTDNLIDSIIESIDRVKFINSEDIPNIDLYMDQVTTFMDKHLESSSRFKGEDKILTKTMINNYAKNDLLPSPNKKKYSKEHVIVLIFIYYYKNILSINDIQSLLKPLTDKYFGNTEELNISKIYDEVVSINDQQIELFKADIKSKYKCSKETFADTDEEEKEFLQMFSFICMLAFDVYSKKLLIEKIIDDYNSKHSQEKATKKS